MSMNRQISRRTVLRGIGAAISLPWLESVMPQLALAADGKRPPRRMAFFSVPNGIHMPDWKPKSEGKLDELPPILAPLEPLKSSLTVLSGLTLDGGRAKFDGPGDHARSAASFLTGPTPKKPTARTSTTEFPSIRLRRKKSVTRPALLRSNWAASGGAQAGNCDSGYSCAYSSNISWRTPTSALAHEVNPRAVFDRLFGPVNESADERAQRAQQDRRRKSILDFAAEDAADLRRKLDQSDGRKLDEYLYAVREIEAPITEDRSQGGLGAGCHGLANRPANSRIAPGS